jgi:hypothetical protein
MPCQMASRATKLSKISLYVSYLYHFGILQIATQLSIVIQPVRSSTTTFARQTGKVLREDGSLFPASRSLSMSMCKSWLAAANTQHALASAHTNHFTISSLQCTTLECCPGNGRLRFVQLSHLKVPNHNLQGQEGAQNKGGCSRGGQGPGSRVEHGSHVDQSARQNSLHERSVL